MTLTTGIYVPARDLFEHCLATHRTYAEDTIKGLVKKYRGGGGRWAGAERGWVISF